MMANLIAQQQIRNALSELSSSSSESDNICPSVEEGNTSGEYVPSKRSSDFEDTDHTNEERTRENIQHDEANDFFEASDEDIDWDDMSSWTKDILYGELTPASMNDVTFKLYFHV
jgi:hypothetical protein